MAGGGNSATIMRWTLRLCLASHIAAVPAPVTLRLGERLRSNGGTLLGTQTEQQERGGLRAALQFAARHPEELPSLLSEAEREALRLALAAAPASAGGAGVSRGAGAAAMLSLAARSWSLASFSDAEAPAAGAEAEAKAPARGAVSSTWWFEPSQLKMAHIGRSLWVMAVVAVVGVIAFELLHRRCADADLAGPLQYGEEAHEKQLLRMFAGIWPLVRPFLFQPGSCRPWYYIVTLTALGLWSMVLNLIFALWSKEFWDVIEQKQRDQFMLIMRDFVLLVSTLIIVGTYESYIGMMLVIEWRKWMTKWLLQTWLRDKKYYQLQLAPQSATLDNPDQRIQEDINIFIPTLVGLVTGFMSSLGHLVTMLPVLLVLSPPYAFGLVYMPGWLLYLALLYSGIGTAAAHCIGGKLIKINFAKQKYEADFRYNIVQVRDHAESIALYGAEDCEQKQLEGRFDNIVRIWWFMMLYTKRLGFFTAFYMQTSVTFPYLVLAPSYFQGQITLGSMFMLFRALGAVKGAFDWIISSYSTLVDFRATADRLQNFRAALDKQGEASEVRRLTALPPGQAGAAMVAEGICVHLAKGAGARALWQGAGLSVKEGEFVLLTAPEGSGKSCFFRALAGIWPHASGTVYMQGTSLFVPQRSHIPQGSLKQALTYPDSAEQFTDEEVRKALEAVGLSRTVGMHKLSHEANWEMVLSGGEQQRLAIAHAVLRRPSVLFLDEATSAMGNDGALELYRLLKQPGTLPQGAAVISISHDIDLLSPVHDTRYKYSTQKCVWSKG